MNGSVDTTTLMIAFPLIIIVFYFLVMRPQNKKQKELKLKIASMKKGDRVTTIGGIKGVVHAVKDDVVILKVDEATKMEFLKTAVSDINDSDLKAAG